MILNVYKISESLVPGPLLTAVLSALIRLTLYPFISFLLNPSCVRLLVFWAVHLYPHIIYVLARWVLLDCWMSFPTLLQQSTPFPPHVPEIGNATVNSNDWITGYPAQRCTVHFKRLSLAWFHFQAINRFCQNPRLFLTRCFHKTFRFNWIKIFPTYWRESK